MLSTFDQFFLKRYDRQHYNCLHFAVEVWEVFFGLDLSFLLPAITMRNGVMNEVVNRTVLKQSFRRIKKPITPSLALLHAPTFDDTHIATFMDGRLFHIIPEGVRYFPIEVTKIGFPRIAFYEYIEDHQ